MKKILIIGLMLVILTGCNNKKELNTNIKNNNENSIINEEIIEDNILTVHSEADTFLDFSDNSVIFNSVKYVALVKIEEVAGSDNYSYVTNQYVLPYTYGKMKILKVFKGDLEINKVVDFYRLGATMEFDKYYEGLTDSEKDKINKLNEGRKVKYKYVDSYTGKKVQIEKDKFYLVYLTDEKPYKNEENSYAIIGFEYGLRKVKTDNDNLVTTESFKDLDVLNNETGEYEKLSSVVNKNSY